jgi:iron complex outermembrane receptor protein
MAMRPNLAFWLPASLMASEVLAQRPDSRDSVQSLPGVTVSATRSESRILTTPLAVTKIDAPEIRSVSGFGLDEALSRVPGVIAQSRYGTSDIRLMIRGYGARGAGDRSNSGTSRGVRVLLDGFPETEPDGRTALDQLDLGAAEGVEVIRSNASALWGNAAGGVVNVITMPGSTRPTVEVQPMFGGFGLARYAVRTSAPIGERGVLWANFTNTSFEGWREHSDARRALVNGGASGRVGDRTRLGVYFTAANNLMHVPGPLTQAQVDEDPNQANPTYLQRDERRYNRIGRLGVSVDHDLSSTFSLSSMLYVSPKYLQRSERNTFRDFTRYHVGGNVVARKTLTTSGTRSVLTLGLDEAYQDGAILFYTLSPAGGRGTTLTDNKGEGANNFGVFVQDELSVGTRLTLLLGARYDAVAYNYRSFLPNPPVRSDRRDFSRVSPKLGVSWLVGASRSVYANVGGGIEVPAGNETDVTPGAPPALLNPLLDPIRSTTYEVGFKSMPSLSNGGRVALGYDVALYDIEVDNEIVPYNGGRYYLTAAKARRQGAELGVDAKTASGLFANGAFTFSRNIYRDYVVDSAVIFPADPTKAGKRADYSDNRVVGIPDALANVEVGAEVPGFRALRLKAGVEHSGKYFADDANKVRVPSFTVLNLTAELRDPIVVAGVRLGGFVSVRNLTDKRYIGSAFLNPDLVGGAPAAFEPGMPRAVVLSLSLGRSSEPGRD